MNTRLISLFPAFIIACSGIVLLCRQHTEIAGMQESAQRIGEPRQRTGATLDPAVPAVTASRADTRPGKLTSGEERAAAFLAGLSGKAMPLVEKSEREAAANRARFTADRSALLVGLSATEKDALRQYLESQNGPDDKAARDWIEQHCRPEQLASFDAAEAARRTAEVEHQAQEAIFRLSRIVDLTPEQKDRLYAGFVSKGAAAPANETAPMELRTAFTVSDTPQITDPMALARPLLTPEQLAFFNAAVEQETNFTRESTQGVMGQLMPVLMSALEEAAAERE